MWVQIAVEGTAKIRNENLKSDHTVEAVSVFLTGAVGRNPSNCVALLRRLFLGKQSCVESCQPSMIGL